MWHAERFLLRLALALLLVGGALAARAQEDPPGRVGRLAQTIGAVSWFDQEQGQWAPAERNIPLTTGDLLATAADGRAELRVGSSVLRLAGATEIELLRLDDERISVQLHRGSIALRVRSREVAAEIELVTREARLLPLRAGHYRIDRIDDTTDAGSWHGTLRIDDAAGLAVEAGQRAELWREGPRGEPGLLRQSWTEWPDDAFGAWAQAEDRRDERSASSRYVSPEMTGAEDLDRYGRWDRHPEFGAIWWPLAIGADWSPYRQGHWAWVRPWGWTWVDDAPWGFAPFHYGRWVHWRGRWGWCPGNYVPRPVYAPALVAWVGGAQGGVAVGVGAPAVGWVPLAPREVFVPYYRSSAGHAERINNRPDRSRRPLPAPDQAPAGPVHYGNQGAPGGLTVVPRDVLMHRQPVDDARSEAPDPRRRPQPMPLTAVPPPVRDVHRPQRTAPDSAAALAEQPATPRPSSSGRAPQRSLFDAVRERTAPPAAAAPARPPVPAAAPTRGPTPQATPAAPAIAHPRQDGPERPRPRDDERKGLPERGPGMRERENLR